MSFFVVLIDIMNNYIPLYDCAPSMLHRGSVCCGYPGWGQEPYVLSSHEEEWVFVFGDNFTSAGSPHFEPRGEFLSRVRFGRIYRLVAAIAMITDQRIIISIRLTVRMAVAIACNDLKVGKDCFNDSLGIGLIDQLLDLFRNQFITLYQGLSNGHNSLAVFLEKMFYRLELGLKHSLNAFSQLW